MKSYTIHYVHTTPDWSTIPSLHVNEHLWIPSDKISMTVQICYNEDGFYVHMKAVEPHIRAEHNAPLSMICEDSCMEWFFCPQKDDSRYINFEINPNGYTFIGISHCRADNVRLCPPNEEELFHKTVQRTPDGWEVYYTIPVSFLRVFFPDYKLVSGLTVRANCYKCGDLTVSPHYISWNPVDYPTPDFHRPCDFGTMILE